MQMVVGYEVGGVIGIGTFGEVRHGEDCSKEPARRHVALKIIDLSRFPSEINALVVKEVKLLQMLDHERCARILEVHEHVPYKGSWCDSCACTEFLCTDELTCAHCSHSSRQHSVLEVRSVLVMVLELGAGGELFSLLMQGPFPEDLARFYFRQLIQGLEYVHAKSISHRDLKPENLVLDAEFNLKIVDFGLASLSSEMQVSGGLMYSGVGSLPYSAPEVYYSKELYRNMGYRGPPADVWSCGVILFVMLTSHPPFARPLAKTYSKNLKRCKHFCRMVKGLGYEGIGSEAKHLLTQIFQIAPEARPTLADIKNHPWLHGPIPERAVKDKVMEQKAIEVWHSQRKTHMVDVLTKLRLGLVDRPHASPVFTPGFGSWTPTPLHLSASPAAQSPITPIMFTPGGGVSSLRPLPGPPEFQLPPQAHHDEGPRQREAPQGLRMTISPMPVQRPTPFPWGSHTTVSLRPMPGTGQSDELGCEVKKEFD